MSTGSFNTPIFRLNSLVAVGLLQAYLMWNFITFHLRKNKEKSSGSSGSSLLGSRPKKTQQEKAKERKEKKKDEDDLPEVDQNTKASLRQRNK